MAAAHPSYMTAVRAVTVAPSAGTNQSLGLPLKGYSPVVKIIYPQSGQEISGRVDITGTACDDDLDSYKLEYAPAANPTSWQLITQTSQSVVLDKLATWDTRSLAGNYNLRLTARDQLGNETADSIQVVVLASATPTPSPTPPTPSPSPTLTPSPTPSITLTPTPMPTPSPTPSTSPTASPTPPGTPTPTPTPSPTPSPSPTPTAAPSLTPTATPTPTPVPATKVQAGTLVLGAGGAGQVSITVKNIPSPGLGAYNVRVDYDSTVISVTDVLGGTTPFSSAPTKNLGTPGQARLNAFQANQVPGPTGDIIVAYLAVSAVGSPGQVSPLTLVLTPGSLADTGGNSIPSASLHGSVTIFGADFTGSPVAGGSPLTVSFTDNTVGSPTSWSWNLGDGTTSSSQHPTKSYAQGGNYTVSLTATSGSISHTKTKSDYIKVIEARFSGTPTGGIKPLTVNFADESRGTVTGWSWSFGDGTSSSSQHPNKVYPNLGTYNVSLTVTGPAGASSTSRTAYITVSEIQSIPGFGQSVASSDNVVLLDIRINRIRNPSTDADVPAPGGIGGYDFTLTYPGGTSGNAVNILGVRGVAPFVSPTGNVQNGAGSTRINAVQTGSVPQAFLTLAQVAPRILGSSEQAQNIVLSFASLANVASGANIPQDSPKTFTVQRGDARKDGTISIADALFVAQYLVGLRDIGDSTSQVHVVNAASVKTDGPTGDQVTIADALLIAQMLAGLRDASFN